MERRCRRRGKKEDIKETRTKDENPVDLAEALRETKLEKELRDDVAERIASCSPNQMLSRRNEKEYILS